MSQSSVGSLWLKWKSLKLPWRRKWIVGQDLAGVTFYEHRHNPIASSKPRRTASYPHVVHPSDVILTPAWLQWLRHTRPEAPTIQEQRFELQRQSQLKQLAAAADRRWNEKPSFLDRPQDTAQAPAEVFEPRDRGGYGQVDPRPPGDATTPGPPAGDGAMESSGMKNMVGSEEETIQAARGEDVVKGRFKGETKENSDSSSREGKRSKDKQDPWRKHRGAPSEEWQPSAWTPGKMDKR